MAPPVAGRCSRQSGHIAIAAATRGRHTQSNACHPGGIQSLGASSSHCEPSQSLTLASHRIHSPTGTRTLTWRLLRPRTLRWTMLPSRGRLSLAPLLAPSARRMRVQQVSGQITAESAGRLPTLKLTCDPLDVSSPPPASSLSRAQRRLPGPSSDWPHSGQVEHPRGPIFRLHRVSAASHQA